MSMPFQRTTSALALEHTRGAVVVLVLLVATISASFLWAFNAEVTVFETTETARIEVCPGVHEVQTEVSGRVLSTVVALGTYVEQGAVLVELDASKERLDRDAEAAKLVGLAGELAALEVEHQASLAVLESLRSELPAALREARWRETQLASDADEAELEQARILQVRVAGGVSEREAVHARSNAIARRAAANASAAAAERLRVERERLISERVAAIAALERSQASVRGAEALARAQLTVLDRALSVRTVRAPIAGHLAQVYPLEVGTVLEAGSRIAAIVPPGRLQVVAQFPVAALGRIQPGQQAWMRLKGFPWTEYGKVSAKVGRVSSEAQDGKVRVELALATLAPPRHVSHGLTGSVEVEVEEVTPATLLMRMATRRLTGIIAPDDRPLISQRRP